MLNRVNWKPYEHLFSDLDDVSIATAVGVSEDAVRLKRKRLENGPNGFIGLTNLYFDLETTGLSAIMGRLLCGSFCDSWGNVTTFRVDETTRRNQIDDRELAVTLRDYIEDNGDILVGWNSKLFDVAFLNSRLLKWGERPLRKDLKHIDLMYYAGGQFNRIGSRKLVNVQKFSPDVDVSKTDVDWDTWALAGAGSKEALDYVVEHCEADILVLRKVFQQLKPHITIIHR